jgi:hypothetical protein
MRFSLSVGAPQVRFTVFYIILQSIPSSSVILHWDRHSVIPSVLISTLPFHAALYTAISAPLSWGLELLNSHWHTLVWIVAPIFNSALCSPTFPFSALLHWDRSLQSPSVLICKDSVLHILDWVLPCLDWCCFTSFRTC